MSDLAMMTSDTAVDTASTDAVDTLSPLQQFRADAWTLLGSLLSQPPSNALLQWLDSIELNDDQHSSMREAWGVLQMAARRADPELVAEEYHNLFIGIARGELVPFGSWYMTGFLMEKPLAELRVDLQRLGFERDPDVNEPEDHIAALCQVMAMLVRPDGGEPHAVQREFFERHLGPWWQRFVTDLQSNSTAHFYSAVGRFAELFFAQETLLLQSR